MKRGDAIKNMMEQLGDDDQFLFQIDDDNNLMSMSDLVRLWEYLNTEINAAKITGPDKKEQKPQPKKLKLDDAKMKALRNAGWTYEKIADEMGCSTQTVINHLKGA